MTKARADKEKSAPSMQPLSFVILSTTDWDAPQFGSRQQIALRLARRGHAVLFVDIPRALHSLISDPAGTRRAMQRFGRVREVSEGVLVYTPPPVLPVYYNSVVNIVNQRLILRYLRRALGHVGRHADALWTYWPNTAYLCSRLGEHLAVYHCIDNFAAVGYPLTTSRAIARQEAELCRRVDLVLTRTAELHVARQAQNPNTLLLRGGVDTELFDPARIAEPPAYMAALPRPRVGLVGTIDDRLDVEMLSSCAAALPSVAFVLVGPVKHHRVDISLLQEHPNVHLLPACPHSEAPAVIAGLDVGLIPYRINAYTEGLSPIKLHEYLAMGKPVVATALPYLQPDRAHIRIAKTGEQFLSELQSALLHPITADAAAAARAAAGAQSWDRQVDEIERHLEVLLQAKHPAATQTRGLEAS